MSGKTASGSGAVTASLRSLTGSMRWWRKCKDDGGRLAINHGQQQARRPVGNPATLLPFLSRPRIQPETVGKFLPAQLHPLPLGDDPAGQRLLAPRMGQHLAQRCPV